MRNRLNRRVAAAAGAGISITLLLAACGADQIEGSGGSGDGASGDSAGGGTGVDTAAEIDCAPYEEFGDIEGTEVSLYTSILAPEDQPYIDAFVPFEECTGVDVDLRGLGEFEAQLLVRTQAGQPAGHRPVPAARSAADDRPGHRRCRRAAGAGRGRRRRVLRRGLEAVRHGRRRLLRRAEQRQRQVVRLVLPVGLRRGRLRGPRDLGRHARPVRPDRG
jgi:hypothetical protein